MQALSPLVQLCHPDRPTEARAYVHPDDVSSVVPIAFGGADWESDYHSGSLWAYRVTMRTQRMRWVGIVGRLEHQEYIATAESTLPLRKPAALAAAIERLRREGHSSPAELPDAELLGNGWR